MFGSLILYISGSQPFYCFKTIPHAVETPTTQIFSLLLHSSHFTAIMNQTSINICVFQWSKATCEKNVSPRPPGVITHTLRTTAPDEMHVSGIAFSNVHQRLVSTVFPQVTSSASQMGSTLDPLT